MSILSIIVTYGNRFHYLEQVVKRLLKEKITKILIISNGSDEIYKNSIFNLKKKNKKIKLIILNKNYGSAFAIKKSFKYALKSDYKFILLLDDDNLPELGSLKILKKKYREYGNSFKNQTITLV
jgi:GT2 family glycosyltransferase